MVFVRIVFGVEQGGADEATLRRALAERAPTFTLDWQPHPSRGPTPEHITHADTPDDLVRKGRDIERRVLARAIRSVVERRVILNANRTIDSKA